MDFRVERAFSREAIDAPTGSSSDPSVRNQPPVPLSQLG
jgi:hypothetical protein